MQILKNKLAGRYLLHWCLLISFAFCAAGCDAPTHESEKPSEADSTVIEMDIAPPSNSNMAEKKEETQTSPSSDKGSLSTSPTMESPASGSESKKSSSDEDSEDSPGPSLNAPKSSSTIPTPGQEVPLVSDSAVASTQTSSPAKQGAAFLPIRLLSWNVESGGADSDVVAQQLSELNRSDRYDIVGLSEVEPPDWKKFRTALGEHYRYEFSRSGHNDRLQILFNTKVFEEIRHFDLKEINILNRYRAPLVVHLKHLETEREFLVMLNHLARGKAEIRQQQAELLVEWARDQTLPVIAIGDYNLDYVFKTKKGNPAFKNMLRDNIWQWVQPEELIETNWYDKMGDGENDYPGSILDFAFVANAAKTWKKTCRVIVRKGDFPDDKTTSDHRPFELVFE